MTRLLAISCHSLLARYIYVRPETPKHHAWLRNRHYLLTCERKNGVCEGKAQGKPLRPPPQVSLETRIPWQHALLQPIFFGLQVKPATDTLLFLSPLHRRAPLQSAQPPPPPHLLRQQTCASSPPPSQAWQDSSPSPRAPPASSTPRAASSSRSPNSPGYPSGV